MAVRVERAPMIRVEVAGRLCPLLAFMFGCGCGGPMYEMEQSLEIHAEHWGDFGPGLGSYWRVRVGSEGANTLVVYDKGKEVEVPLIVDSRRLQHLREVLAQEDFFALPRDIGVKVIDGSTRTIVLKWGRRTKSVKIWNLGQPWSDGDLELYQRAATIWAAFRDLFDDNRAFDITPFERRLIRRP